MLNKVLVAALLIGAVLLGGAATAGAGEWNKNGYIHTDAETGEAVPNPGHSICSYSGLDDVDEDDDALLAMTPAKGRVQSPGQYVAFFGAGFAGVPGQACRGNAVHE